MKKQLIPLTNLTNKNYDLISGKLFKKNSNIECKNPDKEIYRFIKEKARVILDTNEIDDLLEDLRLNNDEIYWKPLQIVEDAKRLGALPKDTKLPFDLDEKQLVIINKLLYHPLEEIMFITTGCGGSGKSTYLNIIKQLFDNDVSSASLSDLTNTFTVAEAIKHRLIASDELGKDDVNLPVLKQLISKQNVYANPKHMRGYDVKSQSALFFCCNQVPKLDVMDDGILRRIYFYERNTKIVNPDVTLNRKIYTYEELLTFARVALNYESDLSEFKKETHQYLMENNSVYRFMKSTRYAYTYTEYAFYCNEKRMKSFSEPNFDKVKALFEEWIAEDEKKIIDETLDMFGDLVSIGEDIF